MAERLFIEICDLNPSLPNSLLNLEGSNTSNAVFATFYSFIFEHQYTQIDDKDLMLYSRKFHRDYAVLSVVFSTLTTLSKLNVPVCILKTNSFYFVRV